MGVCCSIPRPTPPAAGRGFFALRLGSGEHAGPQVWSCGGAGRRTLQFSRGPPGGLCGRYEHAASAASLCAFQASCAPR
eukprot:scaffold2330_cov404-Pinguiococcus_pyrenoidosus.AAC.3